MSVIPHWRYRVLLTLADESGLGGRGGRYRGYGKVEVIARSRSEAADLALTAAIGAWNGAFPAPAEPARIMRITRGDLIDARLLPDEGGECAVVSVTISPYRLFWRRA